MRGRTYTLLQTKTDMDVRLYGIDMISNKDEVYHTMHYLTAYHHK